jgi:hypothetical protein
MARKNFTVSDGVVINATSGNIGFEVYSTDAMKIPEGNTSTRPSVSANGLFRYNPFDQTLDLRENSVWKKGFLGNSIIQSSDLGTLTFSQNVDISNSGYTNTSIRFGQYMYLDTGSNTVYFRFRSDLYIRFWANYPNTTHPVTNNTFELNNQGTANLLFTNTTSTTVQSINSTSMSVAGNNMVGRQARWIPAGAMEIGTVAQFPERGLLESTNGEIWFETLNFDQSTEEFAFFTWTVPKSWDGGGLKFVPVWSHGGATSYGVTWRLLNRSYGDSDALSTSIGNDIRVDDTGGTTNDIYIGPESANVTLQNSPSTDDLVIFRISRFPADAADTLNTDALLIGITLYYWTTALSDE